MNSWRNHAAATTASTARSWSAADGAARWDILLWMVVAAGAGGRAVGGVGVGLGGGGSDVAGWRRGGCGCGWRGGS